MTLISVITAVYNGATYLPDLIESVQAQTFTDYEHIIIDDGSTDETAEVIARCAAGDPRIRWWSRENKGAYPTQQEGLQTATGQYVVIINADDRFAHANVFEDVACYLHNHPEHQLVYGKTCRIDEHGTRLPQLDPQWRPSQWLIRHLCYVQHCSLFVSREMLVAHDLWLNLDYRYAADWDWIIRLFIYSDHIGYMRETIGCFRLHYKQRSRAGVDRTSQEVHAICQTYGSSARLHFALRQLLIYRAMTLVGLDILRKQGVGALWQRIRTRSEK